MATIGATYVDLIDGYRQTDENGATSVVIEVLKQFNPIMDDAVAVECNLGTRHRHRIRTGLPAAAAWGRLYKGVPLGESNWTQVEDTTGWIEERSGVDKRLLALQPDKEAEIRMQEANGILEAMSQKAATAVFYENVTTNPEGFSGLAARYSATGTTGPLDRKSVV